MENDTREAQLAELEALLRNHDWYYEMSDAHNVWKKGQASMAHICKLLQQLPNADGRILWTQYAPRGFPYPALLS